MNISNFLLISFFIIIILILLYSAVCKKNKEKFLSMEYNISKKKTEIKKLSIDDKYKLALDSSDFILDTAVILPSYGSSKINLFIKHTNTIINNLLLISKIYNINDDLINFVENNKPEDDDFTLAYLKWYKQKNIYISNIKHMVNFLFQDIKTVYSLITNKDDKYNNNDHHSKDSSIKILKNEYYKSINDFVYFIYDWANYNKKVKYNIRDKLTNQPKYDIKDDNSNIYRTVNFYNKNNCWPSDSELRWKKEDNTNCIDNKNDCDKSNYVKSDNMRVNCPSTCSNYESKECNYFDNYDSNNINWDNGVRNLNKSCLEKCDQKSGLCSSGFCGTGLCCKYGTKENECDGNMGNPNDHGLHVCSINPLIHDTDLKLEDYDEMNSVERNNSGKWYNYGKGSMFGKLMNGVNCVIKNNNEWGSETFYNNQKQQYCERKCLKDDNCLAAVSNNDGCWTRNGNKVRFYTDQPDMKCRLKIPHINKDGTTNRLYKRNKGLRNKNKDCLLQCGGLEGPCTFCGTGICCKPGTGGQDCIGGFSGNKNRPNNYTCSPKLDVTDSNSKHIYVGRFSSTSSSSAKNNSYCLDHGNLANSKNSGKVQMWKCDQNNDSEANRKFFIKQKDNDKSKYIIHNGRGYCLDHYKTAKNEGKDNGGEPILWKCAKDHPNQDWKINVLENGTYQITNARNHCLDHYNWKENGRHGNAGDVLMWKCDKTNKNQHWYSIDNPKPRI